MNCRFFTPGDITRSVEFRQVAYYQSPYMATTWAPLLALYSEAAEDVESLKALHRKTLTLQLRTLMSGERYGNVILAQATGTLLDAQGAIDELYRVYANDPETYSRLCSATSETLKSLAGTSLRCRRS